LFCTSKTESHSSTKTGPGRTRPFLCAPSSKITVSSETSQKPAKGRSNEVLFEKLGKTNTRSRDTENSSRISNTLCFNSKAKSNSQISKHVKRGDITSGSGDRANVGKECYRNNSFSKPKSISKFSVPGFQKGWREQTSDKSEVPKQTHSLPSFQDGKLVLTQRTSKKGGLHGQDRPFGRLFLNPDKSRIQEVCEIQVETKNLPHGDSLGLAFPLRAGTINCRTGKEF